MRETKRPASLKRFPVKSVSRLSRLLRLRNSTTCRPCCDLPDGVTGSLTLIGSGLNRRILRGGERTPRVTQSTLVTVKCFLGLSYERGLQAILSGDRSVRFHLSRYRDQLGVSFFNQKSIRNGRRFVRGRGTVAPATARAFDPNDAG